MEIDFFERKARLKDLEVWEVRCGSSCYQLVIRDEQRIPEPADLDSPDSLMEEEARRNVIKAIAYSETQVEESHIEPLDIFVKQLTDHVALAHCDVVLTFQVDGAGWSFEQVLQEDYGVDFEAIPLERLWHLNQD